MDVVLSLFFGLSAICSSPVSSMVGNRSVSELMPMYETTPCVVEANADSPSVPLLRNVR